MKKTPIYLGIMLFIAVIMGFSIVKTYEVNKKTAEVSTLNGLLIFFNSEPVMDYEYLGTEKVKITWDDQIETRLNKMTKKVKKDFPKADAIIFRSFDLDRADAIEFNE